MFYFEPETIAFFKDLAKQHGVESDQYKTALDKFFRFDYEIQDDEELQAAKYALNRYAQGHTCHDWYKSHKRITENACKIYTEKMYASADDFADWGIVAVHTFEPIGVIAEIVKDGETKYFTQVENADICDEDLDGVIDYLWNQFVKHALCLVLSVYFDTLGTQAGRLFTSTLKG